MKLGPYELLVRLASGGAANVFLVREESGPSPGLLALKVLIPSLASNDEFLRMFFAEARIASKLRHPNIVTIAGFGQSDGIYGMAMEYVFGASLSKVLRESARMQKPLTVGVILRIMASVLDALHHAHECEDDRGAPLEVVHRDVTPQNILIHFNGRPKLTDFGIAKATNRGWETQAGIVKGKFSYMSPEQALGKRVDRRSDIFGVGIVLWEALTGRDLFRGQNPVEVLEAIRNQKIEPPSRMVPGLTPIVDPIVMRALRRAPRARYQTAGEMRDDIESLIRRAGVEITEQSTARELAAIYGDQIVERAFALRAAMAGNADLEHLAKVLGGQVLSPKHLPEKRFGPSHPDPLGLFRDTGTDSSGEILKPALPARSDASFASAAGSPQLSVAESAEFDLAEIARMEPDDDGPQQSETVSGISDDVMQEWDGSTSMAVPEDELLAMLSEVDATIGTVPPEFAERLGTGFEPDSDVTRFDNDEETVGVDSMQAYRPFMARDTPSSRPVPRAPSLDLERARRQALAESPKTAPGGGPVFDASGTFSRELTPSMPDVEPLLPESPEPKATSMPGQSVMPAFPSDTIAEAEPYVPPLFSVSSDLPPQKALSRESLRALAQDTDVGRSRLAATARMPPASSAAPPGAWWVWLLIGALLVSLGVVLGIWVAGAAS
jgi:serine/threonine protein kinase